MVAQLGYWSQVLKRHSEVGARPPHPPGNPTSDTGVVLETYEIQNNDNNRAKSQKAFLFSLQDKISTCLLYH